MFLPILFSGFLWCHSFKSSEDAYFITMRHPEHFEAFFFGVPLLFSFLQRGQKRCEPLPRPDLLLEQAGAEEARPPRALAVLQGGRAPGLEVPAAASSAACAKKNSEFHSGRRVQISIQKEFSVSQTQESNFKLVEGISKMFFHLPYRLLPHRERLEFQARRRHQYVSVNKCNS